MNIYYNYILCNPLKKGYYKIPTLDIILPCEPFYVGKGKGQRKDKHLWEVNKNIDNEKFFGKNNKHKKNTIRKILKNGLEPYVFVLKENSTDDEVRSNEIFLIKAIGRRDLGKGCLTNLTDGGEGSSGYKHTPEALIMMGLSSKGKKPMLGKKHSEESKKKVSETKKEQYRLGIYKGRKGVSTGKKADNALAIIVFDPFTETYDIYDSIRSYLSQGWCKENAWLYSKINQCCRGEMAQYNRLIYIYEKDFTPEYLKERLQRFRSLPKGKSKPKKVVNEIKSAA